jgi:hypothetical protein
MPPENTKLPKAKQFFETFLLASNAGSMNLWLPRLPAGDETFRPVSTTISALVAADDGTNRPYRA